MNIEGTYTLQASPEDVWHSLSDQHLLQQSIPGIEQLEQVDEHTYALAMHIKQTPLLGVYHGHVSITEQHMPYHCRITIASNGRQSTMSGSGIIHLNKHDDTTIVVYKGTLQLGKADTLLPPVLGRGAAKLMIQQFFTALADQLHTTMATDTADTPSHAVEELAEATIIRRSAGDIVVMSPVPHPAIAQTAPTSTFMHRLVQLLNLGSGDPEQEVRWEKRLRRISVASGLLFLVWLGTRIPRRP